MKKLISLSICVLATAAMAKTDTKRIRGDVDWENGRWSCSAMNDTDSDILVTSVNFEGERRGRNGGNGTENKRIDQVVNAGERFTTGPKYVHRIDFVRSCVIFFKEI